MRIKFGSNAYGLDRVISQTRSLDYACQCNIGLPSGVAQLNEHLCSLSAAIHRPLSEKSYSKLAQAAATSLSGSSTSKAGAAMVTSGPLAGAVMAMGGLVLAL